LLITPAFLVTYQRPRPEYACAFKLRLSLLQQLERAFGSSRVQ